MHPRCADLPDHQFRRRAGGDSACRGCACRPAHGTAGAGPGGDQNLGALFIQVQQLQQQVMQPNGRLEEQANELRTCGNRACSGMSISTNAPVAGRARSQPAAAAPGPATAGRRYRIVVPGPTAGRCCTGCGAAG